MPYRDPHWWRALLDQAPAIAGGFISAVLHLLGALAAPRPLPPGQPAAALIEAALAWLVGFLAAVYLGPLVAHWLGLSLKAAPEAVGGVKVIIGVIAWKALPILRDKAGDLLGDVLKRKSGSV